MVEASHNTVSQQDLATELRRATQREHATLNAAIITKLPLCLPPHADSAFQYAAGMVVFGQIYTAMEKAWDSILESGEGKNCTLLDDRQRKTLCTLRTQHLRRTERLHSDLTNLKRSLGPHAAHTLDRLHDASCFYHDTVQIAIDNQPHVVLAYSWTMYLALFNGGRYIVKLLLQPGSSFWFGEQNSDRIAEKYLSFWYFDDSPRDNEHGSQVKNDFKSRFSIAALMLSEEERLQVITECHAIFAQCASMVNFLDLEMKRMQNNETQPTYADQADIRPDCVKPSYLSGNLPLAGIWQNLISAISYATNATTNAIKV